MLKWKHTPYLLSYVGKAKEIHICVNIIIGNYFNRTNLSLCIGKYLEKYTPSYKKVSKERIRIAVIKWNLSAYSR